MTRERLNLLANRHQLDQASPQTAERSAKLNQLLVDAALAYIREILQGGGELISLVVALEVIISAYELGLTIFDRVPRETKGEVAEVLRLGRAERARFLVQANRLVDGSQPEVQRRRVLGISHQTYVAMRDELAGQRALTVFPNTTELMRQMDERQVILPELASAVLHLYFVVAQGRSDTDVSQFIPEAKSQSMVLRGVLIAVLGRRLGVQRIDPFHLTDESLLALMPHFSTGVEHDPLLQQVVAVIMTSLPDELNVPSVQQLLLDYSKQVVQQLTAWANYQAYAQDELTSDNYWQKKSEILGEFPLAPFTPGVQFIFKREHVLFAHQEQIPHLWQNPLVLGRQAMPSPEMLNKAISLSRQAGFADEDPQLSLLIAARDALATYFKNQHKRDVRLSQAQRRIEGHRSYIEQNPITDPTEKTSSALSRIVTGLATKLKRSERLEQEQQRDRAFLADLDMLQAGDEAAQLRAFLLVYEGVVGEALQKCERRILFLNKQLRQPGLHRAFSKVLHLDHHGPRQARAALTVVEQALEEIGAAGGATLPKAFLDDPTRLQLFFTEEFSEIIRKGYKSLPPEINISSVLIRDAIVMARTSNWSWSGFRIIAQRFFSFYRVKLSQLLELYERRSSLSRSERLVTQGLESGHPQADLLSASENEVEKTVAAAHLREVRGRMLTEEEAGSISDEDILAARRVLDNRALHRSQIRFTFPAPDLIATALSERITELTEEVVDGVVRKKNIVPWGEVGFLRLLLENIANPLFPLEYIGGYTLAPALQLLERRIELAELRFKQGVRDRHDVALVQLAAARKQDIYENRQAALQKLARECVALEKAKGVEEENLLARMRDFDMILSGEEYAILLSAS